MARERFLLVGHHNPFDEYPAKVVPICRRSSSGQLVAVYGSQDHDANLVELSDSFVFSAHPESVEFDPGQMRVFARNAGNVTLYEQRDERATLEQLWAERAFDFANPFSSLPIACAIESKRFVTRSLLLCVSELGNAGPFVDTWYYKVVEEHRLSRFGIPATRELLTADISYVTLGCPIDKEQWVRRLCRGFNGDDQARGRSQIVVESITRPHSDEVFCDATILSDMAWMQVEEMQATDWYVPLWQGMLAVAVNPNSPVSEAARKSWGEIVMHLAQNQDARWVQGRADSAVGGITNAIIDRVNSDLVSPGDEQQWLSGMKERAIFAPSDLQIINAAVNGYDWKVDALFAQELSIRSLLSDLPSGSRPIIVSAPNREWMVPNGAITDEKCSQSARRTLERFASFLSSPSAEAEMLRAGAMPGGSLVDTLAGVGAAYKKFQAFERPMAVYLIIDSSDSMQGEKLEAAKVGLAAFLGQLSEQRGDLVGLISFGSVPEILVHLDRIGSCGDDLGMKIAELKCKGGTAIRDALILALDRIAPYESHIRAAMLLTDGRENASTHSEAALMNMISTTEVRVFGLAYGKDADVELLGRITSRARGEVFYGSVSNVRNILALMARQV